MPYAVFLETSFCFEGLKGCHKFPTRLPTLQPTNLTDMPTLDPTTMPSATPTLTPTEFPTAQPTSVPTERPSLQPPSPYGSKTPSEMPTYAPTLSPTELPTPAPTIAPTSSPVKCRSGFSIAPCQSYIAHIGDGGHARCPQACQQLLNSMTTYCAWARIYASKGTRAYFLQLKAQCNKDV